MDIHDPRARWPDGRLVDNPFCPGSFRWSMIAEWWFWMDDTRIVIAEIMKCEPQNIYDAQKDVKRKTGWDPVLPKSQRGRPRKEEGKNDR